MDSAEENRSLALYAPEIESSQMLSGQALSGLKVINTDEAPTYAAALADLKKEGKCSEDTVHRPVKYLNNVVEADRSLSAPFAASRR